MNVTRFPTVCPVCGGTVRTAPDAVANHADCHRQAYRMAQHADAMRTLAKVWPAHETTPVPTDPGPRQLALASG